ncbi:MAG: hypothetical protein AAFX53_05320 [Bacteroidota bacterium]
MKNVFLVLSLLYCVYVFPQQGASKNDIVFKANGELLQVKVTKITDGAISFVYPGETVVYEMDPATLEKIVFASGRTQNFGGNALAPSGVAPQTSDSEAVAVKEMVPVAPSYKENLVSVIPLDFQRNGKYEKTLASKATEYVLGLIVNEASKTDLEVQKMGSAIEKLIDSGFSYDKLREASPEELRKALGTEYILFVSIKENEKGGVSKEDFMSGNADANAQLERQINIRLYAPESETEAFEVDFSENVFMGKTSANSSLAANGKWKASLRYLTEQLFSSNAF